MRSLEGPPLPQDASSPKPPYQNEIDLLRSVHSFRGRFSAIDRQIFDPQKRPELVSIVDQLTEKSLPDLYFDVSAYERPLMREPMAQVAEIADLLEPVKESALVTPMYSVAPGASPRSPSAREIKRMEKRRRKRATGLKEKMTERGRDEVKQDWVAIRNRVCQSGFVTRLRKGEYDNRQQVLLLAGQIAGIISGQPIGKLITCAVITMKITVHNLDQICERAGFDFEKMEKKALKKGKKGKRP
jgi:hypothetical protein